MGRPKSTYIETDPCISGQRPFTSAFERLISGQELTNQDLLICATNHFMFIILELFIVLGSTMAPRQSISTDHRISTCHRDFYPCYPCLIPEPIGSGPGSRCIVRGREPGNILINCSYQIFLTRAYKLLYMSLLPMSFEEKREITNRVLIAFNLAIAGGDYY